MGLDTPRIPPSVAPRKFCARRLERAKDLRAPLDNVTWDTGESSTGPAA